MAGHSKWSTIKRKKGALDQARGKVFTKLGKEIAIAAKLGGGDPDGNARLRHAIASAKVQGMPKDNIERAVKKGSGESEGASYEELVYEGYGPGGAAILNETTTDNKNPTVYDFRNQVKIRGGHLAEGGSVMYLFEHHGLLVFDKSKWGEDQILEVALTAGADDVSGTDTQVEVLTAPNDVYRVREVFDRLGMHPVSSGFRFVPKSPAPVEGDSARKLVDLFEELENHDDVQRIHSNFDMDETLMAELSNG
jgi:YebC/PmpR family DNA-binding regulatory protein